MNIAIVGIGGVGGYFGAKLAGRYTGGTEAKVIFIARGAHLEEIRKNGLQLITQEGTNVVRPDWATDDPAGGGPFDLVFFCVKSYGLEESARLVKNHLSPGAVIISLLNGVDNAERLMSRLPEVQVLNGCVYLSTHIIRPGVVRQSGGVARLFFGPEGEEQDRYRIIEKVLREAGIEAEYRKDIAKVVWEKYLFIEPMASATTYLDKTFGQLLESSESRQLLEGLLEEVELVARERGIPLPRDIHQTTQKKIASFPADTKSSMQLDFEKGKQTEIETFTGYIVRFGRSHGLHTPLHEMIYKALSKTPSL
jgi:2-dehydropantoate 2-reductase